MSGEGLREPRTYSVAVICSNCGFEHTEFYIERGVRVEAVPCPRCECNTLRRQIKCTW